MRKYCIFCKCKLGLLEKNVCDPCVEKIDNEGYSFFVNIHNERFRSYWNQRQQTISCRVRVTKKGNSDNFKKNILEFLYNINIEQISETLVNLYQEDYELIQKKVFGFLPENREESTSEQKQKQFSLAMEIREMGKFDILGLLELNTVVATKLKGYHKELFFLKCYMSCLTPAIVLRGLYKMNNSGQFEYEKFILEVLQLDSMRELTDRFTYRDEIRLIVENYLKVVLIG